VRRSVVRVALRWIGYVVLALFIAAWCFVGLFMTTWGYGP